MFASAAKLNDKAPEDHQDIQAQAI